MQIPQITHGWLVETETIRHCPSPNFDTRPPNSHFPSGEISLLVIHHISLPPHQFGSGDIEPFFCNQLDGQKHPFYAEIADLRVSAHALIKRNGELVQFVNFNDRAWHAGTSSYQGRNACNDFSIGIELEGDEKTPYRYAQYKVLQQLTKSLQQYYPHLKNHITGHEHIAPERKTDPGPTFDWKRYLGGLDELT